MIRIMVVLSLLVSLASFAHADDLPENVGVSAAEGLVAHSSSGHRAEDRSHSEAPSEIVSPLHCGAAVIIVAMSVVGDPPAKTALPRNLVSTRRLGSGPSPARPPPRI